jgi:exopolyphosphatase/pppGpp-phosphohydrolase
MQMQTPPVCAAIDIGSNTIRIVVAHCTPTDLDILATDEVMVRISESVNADGKISPEKRDQTIAILHKFKALAEEYNAHPILAVATEAIRRAANRDEFLSAIRDQTGLVVHSIAGDAEAMLTFYGATYELARESDAPARIAVMDLGGGSMELIVAKNLRVTWHTSLAVGSGWIHDRYLLTDPPTAEDVAIAQSFLQTYFHGLRIKRFPPLLIATGGSANSLLLLAQRAFGLSTERKVLTRDDLIRCEGLLYALPTQDIAQRYQLEPKRVRVLRAGVLIICALLERFKLNELRIIPQGIREGILLAYARSGEHWLQAAQQSTTDIAVAHNSMATIEPTVAKAPETFTQAGRRIIWERVQKMHTWHHEILKNEDIEAVHKMRVASRRLRAALDAYKAICDPKAFKKAYRSVKKMADVLGEARDTDVMIVNLQARLANMPEKETQAGIGWLLDRLSNYRQQQQKTLESHLQNFDEDVLKQQLADCLGEERERNGKG